MRRRAHDIRSTIGGRPRGGALRAGLAALLGGTLVLGACGAPADEPARDEPAQPSTGVPAPPAAPDVTTPAPQRQRVQPVAGRSERRVQWKLAGERDGGRRLELEVMLGGPPCDALTGVEVRATDATVVVTLRAGRLPGARCGPGVEAFVGTFGVVVQLDEPLRGRRLIDGARR